MSYKYTDKTIIGDSIDVLVKQGVNYIEQSGHRIQLSFDGALQSNNVTYVLTDIRRLVHTLRYSRARRYLARELYAYFYGSLDVNDGLANAAKLWEKIADDNGMINSNYGYYVFYQKTPENITQLQFVRNAFKRNLDIRKANINICGLQHKYRTKDYPCTFAIQFHIDSGVMNCDVMSRSTDVITGLPYDMAFFAIINQLVAGLVSQDVGVRLEVGYTAMHTVFTQIYDKHVKNGLVEEVLTEKADDRMQLLPTINEPCAFLTDVYNLRLKTNNVPCSTALMSWIIKNMR